MARLLALAHLYRKSEHVFFLPKRLPSEHIPMRFGESCEQSRIHLGVYASRGPRKSL